MTDGVRSFADKCVAGIQVNEAQIADYLKNSLMLVTALNPHIGHDCAAKIAQMAHKEGLTLKEAAVKSGHLREEDFDRWVDPRRMV